MFSRGWGYAAGAVAAVLALAAAAVMWNGVVGWTHAPRTGTDAAFCGLVACRVLGSGTVTPAQSVPATGAQAGRGASPTPVPSASSSALATAPEPTATLVPTPDPTPVPGPSPSPTASPTPARADVTVSYSPHRHDHRGFVGELVIVNRGGSAVTGWQMVIRLPGDRVQAVWNADWQPDRSGNVIMTPMRGDRVIEPGASLTVDFVAQGDTTELANCTFDGFPCHRPGRF